jgi:type IV secretion system protein VirB5
MPYQNAALLQQAMSTANQRMTQINQLMSSSASAADPKASQEANARLVGEGAMLNHELSQIQLLAAQMTQQSQQQQSKDVENQHARNIATGDISASWNF